MTPRPPADENPNGGLRDDIVRDLRDVFGGQRSFGDAIAPPLAFVITDQLASITVAAIVAVSIGSLIAAVRVRRGTPTTSAMAGLAGVAIAAALAVRTGRSEDFFLPTILSTAAFGVGTLASMLARRPMAAWASHFLRRWPIDWYWRHDVRPAYTAVSAIWLTYYVGRATLTWWLWAEANTTALAVTRVVLSWPTMIPLLIVSYVFGNRRLHRLGGPTVDEFETGSPPPFGRQRGF